MQAVRLTVNYFLQKKRQAGRKAESWDNNKKTELAGKIGLSDQERSKFLPKMACFKKYADFGEPNIEY
jgi:hypothetical protein